VNIVRGSETLLKDTRVRAKVTLYGGRGSDGIGQKALGGSLRARDRALWVESGCHRFTI
jgi:hypothetical protein